jgi:hypothetical protein
VVLCKNETYGLEIRKMVTGLLQLIKQIKLMEEQLDMDRNSILIKYGFDKHNDASWYLVIHGSSLSWVSKASYDGRIVETNRGNWLTEYTCSNASFMTGYIQGVQ